MKKIIITTIALALGVCAYAKTLDVLTKEFNALTTKEARIEYIEANKGDVKSAFVSWKQQGKPVASSLFFNVAYWITDELNDISYADGLGLSATRVYILRNNADGDWYDRIKTNGWIDDGYQFKDWQIFVFAKCAKDKETLGKVIIKLDISHLIADFDISAKTLLTHDNPQIALNRLVDMQTAIALKNPNDARLDTLKTYLRIVREKCIDSKLK